MELSKDLTLPFFFRLKVEETRQEWRCEVRHQSGCRVGVYFPGPAARPEDESDYDSVRGHPQRSSRGGNDRMIQRVARTYDARRGVYREVR